MKDLVVHVDVDEDVTDFTDCMSQQKLQIYRKNTRLLDAVENGDIERIHRLLKLEANPNATCQLNSVSACHMAAMISNDLLSTLIASGAHSFRIDALGRTPLHMAAWAGHLKQIAILLDFPTSLQKKITTSTISPKIEQEIKVFCSGKKHLINIPCKLEPSELSEGWRDSMEHNCGQFNKKMPKIELGWTSLHLASARAHYSCVKLLLAAGADPCAQDDTGLTPLDVVGAAHYSRSNSNVHDFNDTIITLLAAGGKINNTNLTNLSIVNTPLHTAVLLKSEEAIRELLKAGASVTCLNSNGLSALHICVNNRLKEHLQLIANFEYGDQDSHVAIIDTEDQNGLTALHIAVKEKWVDGVRIALGAGATISKQAKDGNTPLHYAAEIGDVEIIEALLSFANYSVDLQNQKGQTALFIAIEYNHLDVVKILIQNGASFINTTDGKVNLNVLHVAAEYGRTEILNFLLTFDVSKIPELINDFSLKLRLTPIFYATLNNHLDCVHLLLRHGAQIDLLLPFGDNIICQETETTVLHVATANNNIELAKAFLHFDSKIINKRNIAGLLPIHEACFHGNRDMITLLIQHGADLSAEHPKLKTPIQMIMNILPKPTDYMQEIFDSYITSICGLNAQDTECRVSVDYKVLVPNALEGNELSVVKAFIDTGNRYNQRRLLQHPLIESFLYLKWISLLPFFYAIIALYAWFLLSFNMYVMSLFYDIDRAISVANRPVLYNTYVWMIMTYLSGAYVIIETIFVKIITKKNYFSILDTWVNLLGIILAMSLPYLVSVFHSQSEIMRGVATLAVLLTWLEMMFLLCRFPRWGFYVLIFGNVTVKVCKVSLVNVCISTLAVLLTWLEMMFLLCRFPRWGFYVLIFGNVTVKVCKVLLTFAFLIIGFSICFMIQFRGKPPFETLWASVSKTLVMMTSEYDYSSTIANKYTEDVDADAHISILRFTFVVFVVLASIVLMNLMIAVAVDDLNHLQEKGNQRRLEKQVGFFQSVDCFNKYMEKYFGKPFYNFNLFKRDSEIIIKPHQSSCKYYKSLPFHIREAIFEKVLLKNKQKGDELCSLELKEKLDELYYAVARQDEKLERLSKYMKKMNDNLESTYL